MAKEFCLDVEGGNLFCKIEKAGDNAPWVIFSNSFVTDMSIWNAQALALSKRYNVLRYDQRGHGKSTYSTDPLNFDMLGDDVLAVLDYLSIQECTFVGLSMGVPTGLRAYQQEPDRFEKLVFVDGMARTAPTGAAAWQERIDFVKDKGIKEFANVTADRWLQEDTRKSDKGKILTNMMSTTSVDGFIQCARALQSYDYADIVPTINIPLLAIAGAKDGAMPAAMQKTFSAVANVQIKTIDNAGHIPNFERPDAFNAVLNKFLE
ncbi:MAG: alpha/beta fold hydrolase [Rhizobiales bacterium]|nr:alpha/beta fold hydrolase [Hyphomicrobiales bacterium]